MEFGLDDCLEEFELVFCAFGEEMEDLVLEVLGGVVGVFDEVGDDVVFVNEVGGSFLFFVEGAAGEGIA